MTSNFRTFGNRGYEVASGPWPFYRQVIAALVIGSIAQMIYGPPPSIRTGFPTWHNWVYSIMMFSGSFFILLAIQFMRQNLLALYIERFGSYMLVGSVGIYLLNYFITSGFPQTPNTWIFTALITYPAQRIVELHIEIRKARRHVRRINEENRKENEK